MISSIIAFAGLAAAAVPAYYPAETAPAYYPETTTSSVEIPSYPESTPVEYTSSTETVPAYPETTSSASIETYPAPPSYPTTSSASIETYSAPPSYPTISKSVPAYPGNYSKPAPYVPTSWTTTTISTSSYETYCPEPTTPITLTYNTKTYVITSATTLTVTDCAGGCTAVVPCPPTTTPETWTSSVPVAPVYGSSSSSWVSVPTAPAYETPKYPTGPSTKTYAPTGTGSWTSTPSSPVPYTGAATKVGAGALMAVAGLAALL